MKFIIPLMFCTLMLAGFASSCKHNPVAPNPKCDTCKTDTTCDTCKHDTIPKASDTTSHNFTWTQSTIPSEAGLTGCWVFGPNSIYVVGGSVYKSTDGKTWKDVTPMSSKGYSLAGKLSGFSMFAFEENDYWLVDGDITFHYDGVVANDIRTNSVSGTNALHSCWGTASYDMYAVGDGGTILHFDGGSWTKMQSGTTGDLHSVWGTSDQNIWAAGYHSQSAVTAVVHYDGTSWSAVPLSNLPGYVGPGGDALNAAWTVDSAGHHKAYLGGSFIYRSTDLGIWTRDSGSIGNSLGSGSYVGLNIVNGNASNDFMAAGDWGFAAHWNGKSWYRFDTLYDASNNSLLTNNASFRGNTMCIVGAKNGPSWIAIGLRN
jgi:hypothetical protein